MDRRTGSTGVVRGRTRELVRLLLTIVKVLGVIDLVGVMWQLHYWDVLIGWLTVSTLTHHHQEHSYG